jgi:hypothetical protein
MLVLIDLITCMHRRGLASAEALLLYNYEQYYPFVIQHVRRSLCTTKAQSIAPSMHILMHKYHWLQTY